MGPTAFRDGIFSEAAPTVRFQGGDQRAYSDGSLGVTPQAQSFRDGIFSQTDPLEPYGAGNGHAYSDGSLGAINVTAARQRMASARCVRGCYTRRDRFSRQRCIRTCRGSMSGLGISNSTKAGLATVGVLVAILVAMPILGELNSRT